LAAVAVLTAGGSYWARNTPAASSEDHARNDYVEVPFAVIAYPDVSPRDAEASGGRIAIDELEPTTKARALHGRKVAIDGFMIPFDIDSQGNISRFALNGFRDMCSYGMPTSPRDWILVRMKDGRRARYGGHIPVKAYGRLEVGFDRSTKSLYRLEGDDVLPSIR
jgi:hypothetical protein